MNHADVLEGVRAALVDTFLDDTLVIDRTTTALDVPGWDSLAHTIVLLAVEKRFGITLPAGTDFADVGELVDAVLRAGGGVA
jgi:acyl carrier protein